MSGQASEFNSHDEPLFVLRYRAFHVFLRTIISAFSFILFTGLVLFPFGSAFGLLFKAVLGGLLGLLSIRSVIEPLSFKEIRLYSDRIVEVRKWGSTEILLANTRLVSEGGFRRKSIFSQDMKIYRGWLARSFLFWRIIAYEESLADPKDVRRFNRLLARLSGRKVQELEWNLDRLIKGNAGPLPITKETLVEVLSCHDDSEQAAYERTANGALLVATLPITLPIGVLWLFVIWWSLR